MTSPVLNLKGVTKSYGAVQALRSVDLSVNAGEVHAIVGENGAGKSTLMGVAAGSILPDQGRVEIGGAQLHGADPNGARHLGLSIVYQHPALLPDLTIAENLLLAAPPSERPTASETRSWAADRLRTVGLDTHPATLVQDVTLAQRHLVEIAKALALKPKVLLLDEPTEPFTFDEIERLFALIDSARSEGTGVVYISHRIPEVQRIADRITVLRDGAMRGTFENKGISEEQIVNLAVGRPVEIAFPPKPQTDLELVDKVVLASRGLSGAGLSSIDLDLRAGEIVGFAGIEGNGQRETIRSLAGLGAAAGEVRVEGEPIKLNSPSAARSAGVCFIANDRQTEGLFDSLSIRENLSVSWLSNEASGVLYDRRIEAQRVDSVVEDLDIKLHSLSDGMDTLSGGNQQKVVFGRALMAEPRVLLVDEPTHGVDAGARMEIYGIMRRLASSGTPIVMLSSDALELQGLCDRVLVFSRGSVSAELIGDEVSEAAIAQAMLTATATEVDDSQPLDHVPPEPLDEVVNASSGHNNPAELSGGWLRRFVRGDQAPSVVLIAIAIILVGYTASQNDFFLTERTMGNTLMFVAVLALASMGQQLTLMVGSIDLSIGTTVSISVVAASFLLGPSTPVALQALGMVALIAIAAAVGLFNATLIRVVKIPSVVATIVSFFLLSGLALWLRPTAGGPIDPDITGAIGTKFGAIPVVFLLAIAIAALLERWSRRSSSGISLRASGSNRPAAERLGVPEARYFVAAHVGCSLFGLAAALVLMSRTGIGDPASGRDLTLNSIAAAVIGGASILGGRGSFLGALSGAVLLQLIVSALPFLDLADEWQFWLVGLLTLVGAAAFTQLRSQNKVWLSSPLKRRPDPVTT